MKIKEREAFIIARTLIRGVESGYSEVTFTIAGKGESVIGARIKWGKKANLFIKSEGKEDRDLKKQPPMGLPLDINELTESIYNAINNSVILADKDLDTSRETFHAPIDDEKFIPKHNDEYEDELDQSDEFDDPDEMPIEDEEASPGQYFYHPLFSITSRDDLIYRVRLLSKAIVEHPYEAITEETGSSKKNQEFLLQVLFFYLYELQLDEGEYCTRNLFEFIKSNGIESLDEAINDADENSLTKRPYSKFSKAPDDVKENSRSVLIMKLINYEEDDFMDMFEEVCLKAMEGNPALKQEQPAPVDEYERPKKKVVPETVIEPEPEPEPEPVPVAETNKTKKKEPVIVTLDEEDETMAKDQQGMNLELEGQPNAYVALKEQPKNMTQLAESRENYSYLAEQINSRSPEFANEMMNVFLTVVENNWPAAEDLYIVAMELALRAYDGNAVALGEKIGTDPRDIIMADYEYRIRKQNGLGF